MRATTVAANGARNRLKASRLVLDHELADAALNSGLRNGLLVTPVVRTGRHARNSLFPLCRIVRFDSDLRLQP